MNQIKCASRFFRKAGAFTEDRVQPPCEFSIASQTYFVEIEGNPIPTSLFRGIWGALLRKHAPKDYWQIFHPELGDGLPKYVIRSSKVDALEGNCFIEVILLGVENEKAESIFQLTASKLESSICVSRSSLTIHKQTHDLDAFDFSIFAPQPKPPSNEPFIVELATPTRLIEGRSMIRTPDLEQLVSRLTIRAAKLFDPLTLGGVLSTNEIPSWKWHPRRIGTVHRYLRSLGRQVSFEGITGYFELPEGLGPLEPVFRLGEWIHVGKCATLGAGQIKISKDRYVPCSSRIPSYSDR